MLPLASGLGIPQFEIAGKNIAAALQQHTLYFEMYFTF